MKYVQQNDVHGSILPTEGTKTDCFCAHTRVHTERAGKPSMSLTSAKARVVLASSPGPSPRRGLGYIMHLPSARALHNLDRYCIILARKLKHLWLAKCVINNT